MARSVDQVEDVLVTVGSHVAEANRLRLDRDPPLTLEVHCVEDLLTHVPLADRSGALEKAIGQSRLAVVDVGDDREVADARLSGHG